jgi:hypothetical protein
MSGVSNGDLANESTFDSAFMFANGDTGTVGKVSLQNTDPISGNSVVNTQRLLNELADTDGVTGEGDANRKVYSSTNYVADGDDRKTAIAKLDDQLFIIQSDLEASQADIVSQDGRLSQIESGNSTFAGNKTFSGDVNIDGNVTILGTTTTINSTTVDSVDPNITVNKSGNDATSEGAGITVDRTGTKGSLKYENALTSKFKIGALASESEVVTVSHNQNISNKTIIAPILTTPYSDVFLTYEQGVPPSTPASGVRKLYSKSDGFYQLDSTGLETKVGSGSGSGSGSGVVNLIVNGSAEDAVSSIFIPYKDTGSRPTDGTGGSPTVGTSVTATNPLNGLKSYLLTKPAAASYQGEGWALPATALDHAFRAKALKISFDYIVNSGTFVAGTSTTDGDIIWTCYDITNSKIVEPSNIKMLTSSTTISDKFEATVQFDSNCTSFRLIAHVASSSTQLIQIKVDNVTVSPQNYVYGTPITDWVSYTPTFQNLGTVVNPIFRYRRVGSSVEIEGAWTNGTVAGSQASVSLPSGLIGTSPYYFVAGSYGSQGSTTGSEVIFHYVNNNLVFGMANWQVFATGTQMATGGICSLNASIPIQGWSSSIQMSDSYDGRIITAKATIATAFTTTINSVVKVPFNTVAFDDVGGFSSGTYTIKSAGKYNIYGKVNSESTAGTGELVAYLTINGVAGEATTSTKSGTAAQPANCNFDFLADLKAGDTVEIHVFQNLAAGLHLRGDNVVFGITAFNIQKVQGPQAIAASEKISLKYRTTAGPTINTTTPVITYGTKVFDTHGIYSGGNVTISRAGKYRVGGAFQTVTRTSAIDNATILMIYVNGALADYAAIDIDHTTTTHRAAANGSVDLDLLSGDVVTFRIYSDVSTTLSTVGQANYVYVVSH